MDENQGQPPVRQHDEPEPDVLPDDAGRGAPAIPIPPAQPRAMTPPIPGWDESVTGEERPHDEPPDRSG